MTSSLSLKVLCEEVRQRSTEPLGCQVRKNVLIAICTCLLLCFHNFKKRLVQNYIISTFFFLNFSHVLFKNIEKLCYFGRKKGGSPPPPISCKSCGTPLPGSKENEEKSGEFLQSSPPSSPAQQTIEIRNRVNILHFLYFFFLIAANPDTWNASTVSEYPRTKEQPKKPHAHHPKQKNGCLNSILYACGYIFCVF